MEYNILPAADRLHETISAIQKHGVSVSLLESKEAAFAQLQSLITAGASVMTGASVTLEQIGFDALLKGGNHPWKYLRPAVFSETDPVKRTTLRKQATLADYYIGSVHAIAETGEIFIASATGSQLPAYAFSSDNVIWVAGAQKVTPSFETALKRVREYALPLEDQHMKQLYGKDAGSFIGKMLIFVQDSPFIKRNVTLLLVNEVLGF